jgi:hypothetical protein
MRPILTLSRVGVNYPVAIIRNALVGVVQTENLLHCSSSGGKRQTKRTRDEGMALLMVHSLGGRAVGTVSVGLPELLGVGQSESLHVQPVYNLNGV